MNYDIIKNGSGVEIWDSKELLAVVVGEDKTTVSDSPEKYIP